MSHEALIFSLYQTGVIQFGQFQLKSGQTSSLYLNLRKIISYPSLLQNVSAALWDSLQGASFDLICGVPYTALPIATCISLAHDLPMVIRRKEKKEYGTKQMIEGEFKPGQTCLLVEDIITTGSSLMETALELEKVGLRVTDVAALIDREQGGRENLEKKYKVHTVLSLSSLLTTLLHSTFISSSERHLIEQFLGEKAGK